MIPINNKSVIFFIVASLVLALFIVTGCGDSPEAGTPVNGADDAAEPQEEDVEDEPIEVVFFTMEEIAQFDGKEGRPAYIVVDGIVYDVTDVGPWRSGSHYGFESGGDVTKALKDAAPHGANMLNQAEIVGKIAE